MKVPASASIRHPAGTPSGGQFAETQRGEADIELDPYGYDSEGNEIPQGAIRMTEADFEAAYGKAGIDNDFGFYWNGDQRLSLRVPFKTPPGDDTQTGVLYAVKRTTGVHTVLGTNKTPADVQDATSRLMQDSERPRLAALADRLAGAPAPDCVGLTEHKAERMANEWAELARDHYVNDEQLRYASADTVEARCRQAASHVYADAAAQVGQLQHTPSTGDPFDYDEQGAHAVARATRCDAETARSYVRSVINQALDANRDSAVNAGSRAGHIAAARRDALISVASGYSVPSSAEAWQVTESEQALHRLIATTPPSPIADYIDC